MPLPKQKARKEIALEKIYVQAKERERERREKANERAREKGREEKGRMSGILTIRLHQKQ